MNARPGLRWDVAVKARSQIQLNGYRLPRHPPQDLEAPAELGIARILNSEPL